MRKKVLYIDYLSPKGHVGFNRAQIDALNKLECDTYYVFREEYAKELGLNKGVLEIPHSFYKSGKIISRVFYALALHYIKRKTKGTYYDAVIFASFESLSISLCIIYKGAYLINHNNIRDLDNGIKRFVYKHISNYYTHVVFNALCQEKLRCNGINASVIIPHGFAPLPVFGNSDILSKNYLTEKRYLFFPAKGLSAAQITNMVANDQNLLDYCKRNGVRIVTRYKDIRNSATTSIPGYLSNSDYYTLLKNSIASVLCYDNQFKYRVSGILFECMAMDLPAVAFHNEALEIYNEYLRTGKLTFSNISELCDMIDAIVKSEYPNYYKDLSAISDSCDAWSKNLNITKSNAKDNNK